MSIVVGIDPSLTSTGVALLHNGKPMLLRAIGSGTLSIRSYEARGDRIDQQCADVMEAIDTRLKGHRIDLGAIEGPAYGASNASTHDGSGLWWDLLRALRARRVPVVVVAPKTRALWASGDGNADKKQVLAAVRTTWQPWRSHITGHDVADALTMAEMMARGAGDELHFMPRRRHIEAMHNTLKWPSNFGPKPEPSQVGAPR